MRTTSRRAGSLMHRRKFVEDTERGFGDDLMMSTYFGIRRSPSFVIKLGGREMDSGLRMHVSQLSILGQFRRL